MSDKDQPPEQIWLNEEALTDHFARVRERYGSPSEDTGDSDESLQQNDLTKELRRGA